jgi:hypothetical protein
MSASAVFSRATVRICDVDASRLGQGLIVELPDHTTLVLTCYHVVARARDKEGILLHTFSSDDHELGSAFARYAPERSDPERDVAVLTFVDAQHERIVPKLISIPEQYRLPVDVFGVIRPHGTGQRINARLAQPTPISLVVDGTLISIDRAWRLIDPTDVRPGISGSPIVLEDDGVIGLIHFSRSETDEYEREVYVVPIESWCAKNPGLRITLPRSVNLVRRLAEQLRLAGVDTFAIFTQRLVQPIASSTVSTIDELDKVMLNRRNTEDNFPGMNAEALYAYAEGMALKGSWAKAADILGEYLVLRPEDWETHFFRGVCCANSREGTKTDLAGLRSYNDAIAWMPQTLEENYKARLFGYRGAILKRLGRLSEAESDLLLARRYATYEYERTDISYNLACVYAMQGNKDATLAAIRDIPQGSDYFRSSIIPHLHDYFITLRNDRDFKTLIAAMART